MAFYDIVLFMSPEAVAAGGKVTLVGGKYVVEKAAATTIQAVKGARPPKDDSALVVQLQGQIATLSEQVAALEAAYAVCQQQLADCQAGHAPDVTPPIIAISAPTSGAVVAGQLNVQAVASDAVGVDRVELFANGVLVGTLTAAPFDLLVDTTTLPEGTAVLGAKAYDAAGNYASATAVVVQVANIKPKPTISNFTATPSALPVGGGSVTFNATVVGADTVKLNGVDVTLPVTMLVQ